MSVMNKNLWQPEPPASSQRERRKQAFREKIIESAIQLFDKKGCEETTLEEICELAEVSRPTFYSYYPSKQDLVMALAERLWLNVAGELTHLSLVNYESVTQYIASFFTMTSQSLTQYTRLEKDLIRQSMNASSGSNMNMLYVLTGMFEAVYVEGQKRGEIPKSQDVCFLAEMTMGCISTVMMRWADASDYPIEQRLTQLSNHICVIVSQ